MTRDEARKLIEKRIGHSIPDGLDFSTTDVLDLESFGVEEDWDAFIVGLKARSEMLIRSRVVSGGVKCIACSKAEDAEERGLAISEAAIAVMDMYTDDARWSVSVNRDSFVSLCLDRRNLDADNRRLSDENDVLRKKLAREEACHLQQIMTIQETLGARIREHELSSQKKALVAREKIMSVEGLTEKQIAELMQLALD